MKTCILVSILAGVLLNCATGMAAGANDNATHSAWQPPAEAVELAQAGREAALLALDEGRPVYTLGDPAQLRAEMGIPSYAVSDPGSPLLGYAIRQLPNGRYADIYICERSVNPDDLQVLGIELPAEAALGTPRTAEETVRGQIADWQADDITRPQAPDKATEGPGDAWLFGQWTRWVQTNDDWGLFAIVDFGLYQMADNKPLSDFFLCDVRFETRGDARWGIMTVRERRLTLDGTLHDVSGRSTALLEHGPSTTVGTSSASYTTGFSVSSDCVATYSSSVTHGWTAPDIMTRNTSDTPAGVASWQEIFGNGPCDLYCQVCAFNYVSFPSAIFRVDNTSGGEACAGSYCSLDVTAEVDFQGNAGPNGCQEDYFVFDFAGANSTISWGSLQGPEIFDFWPPVDPDPVNVGEFVDFSVIAADLNGCDLAYTWRLDGEVVGGDPDYRYTAECYHPSTMSLEVEVTSNGGTLSRDWLVRVAPDSRVPPTTPVVVVAGGATTVESYGQLTLRAGASGAAQWIWQASCGTISGDGAVVTFQAPEASAPFECLITATATNSCGSSAPADVSFQVIPGGPAFYETSDPLPGVLPRSSVAWGDYDNDGDLDILLNSRSSSGAAAISLVYRNDAGSFTDIGTQLQGASYSSKACWGDYDNDGDLDILLSGEIGAEWGISHIYRNDDGSFVDIAAGLEDVYWGSVAWGDYDNDGDLDILLTGYSSIYFDPYSLVYRNDDGSFMDIAAGLEGVWCSSVAWGDYDNDGDLDILLTGEDSGDNPVAKVYKNTDGAFSEVPATGLTGVYWPSVAWGDYDNDGDLDILLAGRTSSGPISRVYRNDGGSFVDIAAGLEDVEQPSVAWGDYDNDGDLDILLAGRTSSGLREAKIYRNTTLNRNTPPAAPNNLASALVGDQLTLSWDAATDAQTPSSGLSYNLQLGTTAGGSEICSPMADVTTGLRRVVQLGNAQQRTSWTITVPDPGQAYAWGVQAVDGAFAGSAFAVQQHNPSLVAPTNVPTAFALHAAVPNPFNPMTTVRFSLTETAAVNLRVYDAAGRLVRRLLHGEVCARGDNARVWDGRDDASRQVAAGVYFCRLQAGDNEAVTRMTLVK